MTSSNWQPEVSDAKQLIVVQETQGHGNACAQATGQPQSKLQVASHQVASSPDTTQENYTSHVDDVLVDASIELCSYFK